MTSDSEYLTVIVEDNVGGIGHYLTSTSIQRIFHGTITVSNSAKGAKFCIKIPLQTGPSL